MLPIRALDKPGFRDERILTVLTPENAEGVAVLIIPRKYGILRLLACYFLINSPRSLAQCRDVGIVDDDVIGSLLRLLR